MSDLIDRQAAIKAIEDLQDCYNGFSDTYDKACIIGALEEVPPAQRTGRWIIKENPGTEWYRVTCSACGEDVSSVIPTIGFFPNVKALWDFCPNCGCAMKGEDE